MQKATEERLREHREKRRKRLQEIEKNEEKGRKVEHKTEMIKLLLNDEEGYHKRKEKSERQEIDEKRVIKSNRRRETKCIRNCPEWKGNRASGGTEDREQTA
ncbi:hypothetical protein AALO_G00279090 [Alosa alosa]|uniref:Uncharacterized protein n=1 Tax=Alosa alosa TaxID=278164 RepID=A0AAV6FIY0_9TELE|nr:hypothetical protein AALO_G00279090 [Alosa alosa]